MTIMIDFVVRGAVLLLLALAVLPALRKQSAALRHWVLTVALLGALVAPLAGRIAPAWTLPAAMTTRLPVAPPPMPAATSATLAATTASTPVTDMEPSPGVVIGEAIAALWIAGVATSVLVLAVGLLRLRWLLARGRPLTSGVWAEQAAALTPSSGGAPLQCISTSHPTLLATVGTFGPRLLVPRAAENWPAERVSLVLAHESAHVRRGDWAIQMTAEIVRALHWFNPLAWIVCDRLRREAEQASDDEVLSRGVAPGEYAETLVAIARELRGPHRVAPAMAVVHPSNFEKRVSRMLTPTMNRRPLSRWTAVAVAMMGCAVLLPLAGAAAQTVRASVSGSVSDPQRGFLPGVRLTLTHTASGRTKDIETDRTGRFSFGDLEPGDYLLEARLPGFAVYRTTATVTADGRADAHNLTMEIGRIQETVTVRASRTVAPSSQSASVDQEQFRRLEEARRKRAAQVCTTAPERPAPFMGGNVRAPLKFVDVRPSYPESLRTAGVTGAVSLAARIGLDGLVEDVRVLSATNPTFASAAAEAVSRWEFDATLLNCVPMPVDMNVTVRFDLEP